jgi:hypothetical protein
LVRKTWIDDRSLKWTGRKFLPGKTAVRTADALLDLLLMYPPPFAIWTDNGTEIKGDFEFLSGIS